VSGGPTPSTPTGQWPCRPKKGLLSLTAGLSFAPTRMELKRLTPPAVLLRRAHLHGPTSSRVLLPTEQDRQGNFIKAD